MIFLSRSRSHRLLGLGRLAFGLAYGYFLAAVFLHYRLLFACYRYLPESLPVEKRQAFNAVLVGDISDVFKFHRASILKLAP